MQNCIFSGHCCKTMCDKSCPTLAETTYLLERNNIEISNKVFRANSNTLNKFYNIIEKSEGKTKTVIVENNSSVYVSDLLTYCGICKYWKGSRLHCTVYSLRYSQYIDMLKDSWGAHSESSELEYMKIWSHSSKLLVISNIDYVNFGDFECRTLLTLLQEREREGLTTIIVSPKLSTLVGRGGFFERLTSLLEQYSKGGDSK